MSTKIITIGAVPAETTGADVANNGPHSPATLDQNIANLRAAVDRAAVASDTNTALAGKSPIAGPGSGQAFSVGELTATGLNFGDTPMSNYKQGAMVVTMVATSGSIALANNTLNYTQIGNIIHASGYLTVASVSAPSGNLTIMLPAGFFSNKGQAFWSNINVISSVAIPAGKTFKSYYVSNGTGSITMSWSDDTQYASSVIAGTGFLFQGSWPI